MRGDSWRYHDEVGSGDPGQVVRSQLDIGAEALEVGSTGTSRGISFEIRDMDVISSGEGESGRGCTAGSESENCHGAHRIFSVAKATMAQRTPRIQNRTTT